MIHFQSGPGNRNNRNRIYIVRTGSARIPRAFRSHSFCAYSLRDHFFWNYSVGGTAQRQENDRPDDGKTTQNLLESSQSPAGSYRIKELHQLARNAPDPPRKTSKDCIRNHSPPLGRRRARAEGMGGRLGDGLAAMLAAGWADGLMEKNWISMYV